MTQTTVTAAIVAALLAVIVGLARRLIAKRSDDKIAKEIKRVNALDNIGVADDIAKKAGK